MVGVMVVMLTSFKRTYPSMPGLSRAAVISAPDPTAGHCRPRPPPETPKHTQASLAQSLVGFLLLSPGFWYAQGFDYAFQESLFPQSL